jgi:L-2-hydroxyglutarate oxidase
MKPFSVAVVGGGIVGTAVARRLALGGAAGDRVLLLEAEDDLARHQSGRNSGVVHSGLYYRPGSARAKLCVEGRKALERYAIERGLPWKASGKLVVATRLDELPRLDDLHRRGEANGLVGLERIGPERLADLEPNVRGVGALLVPETALTDFAAVARSFARDAREHGAAIVTGARLLTVRERRDEMILETTAGPFTARRLVTCAGLWSDRVARLTGEEPEVSIVPFRGEYREVVTERRDLVSRPIYPVPDPALPFLGIHWTPTVDGLLEVGPNAVLALSRTGYRWRDVSLRDSAEIFSHRSVWYLVGRHRSHVLRELWRSLSPRAFTRAAARLVPSVAPGDLVRGRSGVRAQAIDSRGRLLDDFHIVRTERAVHVINAPSPAATASLGIAEWVTS